MQISACLGGWLSCSLLFRTGIQLHHSSEKGSSDYRKGKHRPPEHAFQFLHLLLLDVTNQDGPHIFFCLGSDFIIQLNTQFQGCLCSSHSVFVREQLVSVLLRHNNSVKVWESEVLIFNNFCIVQHQHLANTTWHDNTKLYLGLK